jgi:hypothetical protein
MINALDRITPLKLSDGSASTIGCCCCCCGCCCCYVLLLLLLLLLLDSLINKPW